MAYDIYGNNLRDGFCEVHPHVHEEYPCHICDRDIEREHERQRQHQEKKEIQELKNKIDEANKIFTSFIRVFEKGYPANTIGGMLLEDARKFIKNNNG